jgi:phytoene dehydrogenase-like protein
MEKYDVIVIGAGPNGLTAGAYLAKGGAKVLFLERRHETGGGLVTDEFSGFRFNLHATYMMMIDIMPPYKDLELEGYGCTYIHPEVPVSLLTNDGKALTLYRDLERSVKSIEKFSTKDAKRFKEVYLECKELCDECLIPATYAHPTPPLDYVNMLNQSEIGKKVLEISEKSPKEIIDEWGFENEYLNTILLHLACMWGLDPSLTGVGYMVPLYINRLLNVALVRGGSHRLSSALHKVAKTNGAQVLESAEAVRIIMDNNEVKGVELADGRKFEAKVIITSTDPETTFLKLIGEDVCKKIDPSLSDRAKHWEWESWSLYGIHLALSAPPRYKASEFDPDVEKAFIKIIGYENPQDFITHINDIKEGKVPTPSGHTTTTTDFDPQQAPVDVCPGTAVARWETLAPYDLKGDKWDDICEKYADETLAKWQEYAPNLKDIKVIRRYVYPPTYIEMKLVNMKNGSIKHGSYIPLQMGYFRPIDSCSSSRTPIQNLYLCGASTYPGGMILLGSGYNAAQAVAEDMNIKWWEPPEYVVEAPRTQLI